ncbi:MAG: hypothetical protein U9O65_00925 [Thermotogota bacterium]|nr:hypothetical protein [Thermotogota bacterium]
MRKIIVVIFLLSLSVSVLTRPFIPEEVSNRWSKLIGKYALQCGEHFYIREKDSKLELLYNLHEGEEI